MATLSALQTSIQAIIRNDSILISEITARINDAVSAIAGGIRLPDGRFSSPLPNLFESAVVATTTEAYADLPDNYQRDVFYVTDDNGNRISPPEGGTYYDFMLFLNRIEKKDLSESGSVYRVAIRGEKLYYQGIPTSSKDLTVMYYKKPSDLSEPGDIPSSIPIQFQTQLIKHYVCRDIFGDILEGSRKGRFEYHDGQFNIAMTELMDFIGIDSEPSYYASNLDFTDSGVCE